jgi:TalC/MipB family fructose-6-phosphate aldolase
MKIFIDSSDVEEISGCAQSGLIDGVTTNPSLLQKSGKSPEEIYAEICTSWPEMASISAEVVGDEASMLRLAKKYSEISPQITIKVPCTYEGLRVCKTLSRSGAAVNVTLVFSVAQAILAAKAGATFVSPFVGRIYDQSFDGQQLIASISQLYAQHGLPTQVLAASIRSVRQMEEAYMAGADVVTMPPKIFHQMYRHMLTDRGIEIFEKDWTSLKQKIAIGD